jgi:hypothetical protein
MAIFSGPEIPNNGLVFHYDMSNTVKSWKGKPTTNLANVGLSGMSGVSLSFVGVEDGWKKYSMSGTFSGGTYPYILNITSVSFTGGVTYSSTCYVKTNVLSKFNYFGTGMNYVNVPMNKGGTSLSIAQTDGSFYIGRINFEYTSTTGQTGYILSNPINNTTFNGSTDFVWIKQGQIEVGEFPTPFAGDASTRINTQAILDLTNNNTITANSLTYANDGSFSFNGSSNYISIAQPAIGVTPNNWTIIGWIKPTSETASFFLTPQSAGIDHFLRYDGVNKRLGVQVTQSSDVNNRAYYTASNSVPLNTWTHFSVSISNLTIKTYLNSVESLNQTESIAIANWDGQWIIGQRGNSTNWYTGQISSLQIYNRALSAAEVQQNFEAFRSRYGI